MKESAELFTYRELIEGLEAELRYEEGQGIMGMIEADVRSRKYDLSEQNLVDAAALYLAVYHAFDPQRLSVELLFDETEGVTAMAETQER